jgi:hypothetical protein
VSEYVTIEKANNQAIADMIKQRLDQSGTPCLLEPSNMAAVAGAGASYAVTAPAERADEARELFGHRLRRAPDRAGYRKDGLGECSVSRIATLRLRRRRGCSLAWKAAVGAWLLLFTDAGARWGPIARQRTPTSYLPRTNGPE